MTNLAETTTQIEPIETQVKRVTHKLVNLNTTLAAYRKTDKNYTITEESIYTKFIPYPEQSEQEAELFENFSYDGQMAEMAEFEAITTQIEEPADIFRNTPTFLSKDSYIRPAMQGMNVEYKDDHTATLCFTDGHVMLVREIGASIPKGSSFIVEPAVINQLHKFRSATYGEMTMYTRDNRVYGVHFMMENKKGERLYTICKPVNETYPDYKMVIPAYNRDGETFAILQSEIKEAYDTLKQEGYTLGRIRGSQYAIHGEKREIRMLNSDNITPLRDAFSGPAFQIGVNLSYAKKLTDLHGDIVLQAESPNRALVHRSNRTSRLSDITLLMPVMLNTYA